MSTKWINEYKKNARHMYLFDFKSFMASNTCTIEGLAELLGYTPAGIEAMIKRGTIKETLLNVLKKTYSEADKFINPKT